jgi:PAP2 superfamily
MAWEKLSSSRENSIVSLVALSVLWAALVIAGAWLTNFEEPYLPFAIAGGLAFFLRGAPSRWEIYAWLLISVVFVKIVHLPQVPFWVLRIASSFAVLGFSALLLLGLRAVWSEREGRENAIALLAPSLILILFIMSSANVLRLSTGLSPKTDDAWLYAFDGSLGFQPSFLMGKIMYGSVVLTRSAMLTYLSLPFAMAVVCAWRIPVAARKISWNVLIVLLLAGVAGWILYNVIPGTGPIYAFGQSFPWNSIPYKDLSKFALEKMSIPAGIPRNAMPSLHVGWAVLLCWNSRGLPRGLRAALVIYLLLTVVATMGSGQHYFVDLVVSLPFALAVESIASYALPKHALPIESRQTAMIAGIGFTAAWFLAIRFGVPLALKSPAIPWTLVVATIVITLWLERKMSSRFLSASAAENSVNSVTIPLPSTSDSSQSKNRGPRQRRASSFAK